MFFFLDENKEKIEPSSILPSNIDFWIPEQLPYEFQKGRLVEIQSKGKYDVSRY